MHPTKKNNYLFLFLTISFLGELFHCGSGFQTKKNLCAFGDLKTEIREKRQRVSKNA